MLCRKCGLREVPKRLEDNRDYRCLACENERKRKRKQANPAKYLLRRAKSRAARKSISFSISESDVYVPSHCPALGIPLEFCRGKFSTRSPSLDRIDPAKGYVPGNIQVISYLANSIKYTASYEDLVLVGRWAQKMLDEGKVSG